MFLQRECNCKCFYRKLCIFWKHCHKESWQKVRQGFFTFYFQFDMKENHCCEVLVDLTILEHKNTKLKTKARFHIELWEFVIWFVIMSLIKLYYYFIKFAGIFLQFYNTNLLRFYHIWIFFFFLNCQANCKKSFFTVILQ